MLSLSNSIEANKRIYYKALEDAQKSNEITGVSKATATRHLQYLTEIEALVQTGSGRSTRYQINLAP